jgi:c-di-AMP phosphodiesterase-like protein
MNKLIEKQYLGDRHVHTFQNESGVLLYQRRTQEEYLKDLETQPVLDGYKWVGSSSGILAVDTPNFNLSLGEYTFDGASYWVGEENEVGFTVTNYSAEEFNNLYGNRI